MKSKLVLAALALGILTALHAESFEIKNLEKTGVTPPSIQYLFYLPKSASSGKKSPLILFLHGSGGRGTNIGKLRSEGLCKVVGSVPGFPFAVAAPQLSPTSRGWQEVSNTLAGLIDEITSGNPIDPDRVYLTGLSMGGFGSFALAPFLKTRVAAVAPICGGGDALEAARMKGLPFWIFHGEIDKTVSPERSFEMVFALLAQKTRVKFTTYPELGHNSWDATYEDPELYRWFLRFKKGGGKNRFALATADEKTLKEWEERSAKLPRPVRIEQLRQPDEWIRNYAFSKAGDESRVVLSNTLSTYATSRTNPGPGEITETTIWNVPSGSGWIISPLRSEIKIAERKSSRAEYQVGWSGDADRVFPIPDRIVTISSGGKTLRVNRFPLLADLRDFSVRGNAVKLAAAPVVDGSPDESEWKGASLMPLLSLQGGLPKNKTEARIAYDDQFFYAALICAEPKLGAMMTKETNRDGSVWEDDSVEIFLDTGFDRSNYYHLIASASGVVLDEKGYDRTWDSQALVKTGRTSEAWTIEVAVPWSAMKAEPPRKGARMGMEIVRNRMPLDRETAQWAPTFRGNHFPARFGVLTFE